MADRGNPRKVSNDNLDRKRVRGLYAIVNGTGSTDVVVLASSILAGGCRVLQLRDKHADDESLLRAATHIAMQCRESGALFFVNDRPDIAVQSGADGVHVGQHDATAASIRARYGSDLLIGVSHNRLEGLDDSNRHADYIAVGPCFDTPHLSYDKPTRGVPWVREARRLTTLPLVAIGGLNASRIREVRAAGADAWAVIRAVNEAPDVPAATRALLDP